MEIKITDFRPYQKNTLQGFLNLTITPPGIEIREATLHEKGGKRWIGLPAKPYTDREGKQAWNKIVSFPDNADYSDFQRAALDAVDSYQGGESGNDDFPF